MCASTAFLLGQHDHNRASVPVPERLRCFACEGCLATPCGECAPCKDDRANGGPGKLRRVCVRCRCKEASEVAASALARAGRYRQAPQAPQILEQLEDSLRLLVHLLPAYFGQLAVERAAREHARPRSTSSRYTYAQPSEATRRLIEAESETDMRLYAHAVGLLHAVRGLNIIGGDIVCMMPTKDSPNQITALTAGAIMFEMISMMAENVAAKA